MTLRIYTQNLYNGRADAASFAAALQEHRPHVVAVQELSSNCAEVLRDWGTSCLLDPKDDTTGMGLAVRGGAELSRIEFPCRDPVRAILQDDPWAGVEVVNAHLVNPISRPMRLSLRLRTQELAELETMLRAQSAARVLVGDFNSSPAWPLYRRLRTLATDAAVAAGTAQRT